MVDDDLADVAHALNLDGFDRLALKGYRVDSRVVGRDDLFFALPGQRVDGHEFLGDVAARGAAAAVVHTSYSGPDFGLPLLRVPDVLEALQLLARASVARRSAKIVAITGSIGKTTTKEFLVTLLRQKYRVGASVGNQNSQIGLPLTLLNDFAEDDEVIVLEMGMTHPGNLQQLLSIAPADIALLTGVALVHAVSFESLEHIARTKAEIFTHPKTTLGILPCEIPNFEEISHFGSCVKRSFSLRDRHAEYFLEAGCENVVVVAEGQRHDLGPLQVSGKHNRHNLLGAIAVARALAVDWNAIADALPKLQLPPRRLQRVSKGNIVFFNDSYNACDVSVKAALESLPTPSSGGRKIAVLGTMPELGKFSDACHRDVAHHALLHIDQLFCFGVECQPMVEVWRERGRQAQLFLDRRELVLALESFVQPYDVVLIKGANAKKMWEILDEIALSG